MRKIVMATLALGLMNLGLEAPAAWGQWPHWKDKVVRPNIDLIPPLGNHLPYSYANRLNRPQYLAGKLMYTIEPSSQEAMAWQRARDRGYYANHAPRMETYYLYRKPWEALGPGPRANPNPPKPARDRIYMEDRTVPEERQVPEPPQPGSRSGEITPEPIETPVPLDAAEPSEVLNEFDPAAADRRGPSLTELLRSGGAETPPTDLPSIESMPSERMPPIRLVPAN